MKAARVPDDGGRENSLARGRHPGEGRDPADKNAREAVIPEVTQAETLHPIERPFGHRVTLTTAPLARDEAANVQLFPRGKPPEGCAPLGGFGAGVKGVVLHRTSSSYLWTQPPIPFKFYPKCD